MKNIKILKNNGYSIYIDTPYSDYNGYDIFLCPRLNIFKIVENYKISLKTKNFENENFGILKMRNFETLKI
jgi:hypothetical protein